MSAVDSREMLARMAGVAQLRASQRADPLHAARVTQVRSFQVRRFEHTYADLLHDPRHGAAARFFLEELYAARSFDERDAQFTRVIPAVGRVFPQEVVHTVVRLTELPPGSPVAVVVRQLTEHVQGDVTLIARLKDAGVVPNARVTAEINQLGGVTIVMPGHENVDLPHEMAHAVKVEKI